MHRSTDFEIQQHIFRQVSEHPGINLTKVAELCHISVELARYHLQYLEKHEMITADKQEGFQRYYPKGKIGSVDKKYLSLFRQELLCKIVLFMLQHPHCRHKDVLAAFEMTSRSLLSYYLKKLIKKDIVGTLGEGKDRRFYLKNQAEILHVLMKYEPYKILEGISDTWADFTMRKAHTTENI
jgi:predicted transcriptional regulator